MKIGRQVRCTVRRGRMFGLLAALTTGILLSTVAPASASTYVVDLTGDFGDSTPGDDSCAGGPGGCSLRAAVEESNAHPGPDKIDLPPGNYPLSLGSLGSLVISSALVIDGTGSRSATNIRPAPPGVGRLIDVLAGGNLELSDATVRGATVADSGAGIRSAGRLILRRVVVADNEAFNASGGGVATTTGAAPTLIVDSVVGSPNAAISGNRAGGSSPGGFFRGGGVFQDFGAGTMTIRNSEIEGNSLTGTSYPQGGGIQGGSPIVIVNSRITDNTVTDTGATLAQGGGLLQQAGVLTMRRTTVSGNETIAPGAGIAYSGGAEIQVPGSLIEDSTVADNVGQTQLNITGIGLSSTVRRSTVAGAGNGIEAFVGLELENSTLSGGGSGIGLVGAFGPALRVESTTIAGYGTGIQTATAGTSADVSGSILAENGIGCEVFAPATITSAGGNVEEGDDCGFASTDDLVNTDPQLLPLADNGGPTDTRAIPAGSAAIDSFVAGCPPPPTDQRGMSRPQGNACDSGAFEAPDTEVSEPFVAARKKQKQKGRKVNVKVKAGAQEPVAIVGRGRITIRGKTRGFKLKRVLESAETGERTILRLTPRRKSDNRRILKLLGKGKGLRANLSIRLEDAAGNSASDHPVVRLKPTK